MQAKSRPLLSQLLCPRSIALIGASDRNPFSHLLQENLRGIDFDGSVYAVNKRGVGALGYAGVASCTAIGAPVDAGIVLVPSDAVFEAVTDAVAAGIRNLVVVSSGFDEVGSEGRARQQRLLQYCSEHGVNILGPNCLGFQNHLDRVALGAIPFIRQKSQGSLAIISASGSIATYIAQCAAQQGLQLSHVFATGNEMNITSADLVDLLINDPRVKAFVLFIEGIHDPAHFARTAERARLARKPMICIKVGASEGSALVAAAHTGALVGDDRVFDSLCDKYGIVRVSSVEESVASAGTILSVGPLQRPGVGVISISGGICGIVSDLSARHGVPLPQFTAQTRRTLSSVVSNLGQTLNPIDLTGQATRDFSLWSSVPRAIAADPGIGLTVINMELPSNATPRMPASLPHIAAAVHSCAGPVLLMSNIATAVNDYGQAFLSQLEVSFAAPGIDLGIQAVGKLIWWSERVQRAPAPPTHPPLQPEPAVTARPTSERDVLTYLARFGVPVISVQVTHSAEEAVAAARRMGVPVALKIVSADIAHKTDIGGVKINVSGDSRVREAFEQIRTAAAAAKPQARFEGISVAPFRSGGVEILVGIARDPQWGLVMAIGLGGVWVEALQDTALRLLPVTENEVVQALQSLRSSKLLQGFRGAAPISLRAVAQVAIRISEAAFTLGSDLQALEVNPLFARDEQIEALDALAVWKPG